MTFGLFQQHIANRLGVAEEHIRALRRSHLREGEHFTRDGNRILYSEAGVERLRVLLEVPAGVGIGAGPAPAEVAVTVVKRMVNPHFVTGRLGDGLVEVRVRDNRLLVPGMVMVCLKDEAGRWLCPRVPRRKGAW